MRRGRTRVRIENEQNEEDCTQLPGHRFLKEMLLFKGLSLQEQALTVNQRGVVRSASDFLLVSESVSDAQRHRTTEVR